LLKNKNNLKQFRRKGQIPGEKVVKFCKDFVENIEEKTLENILEFFKEFSKKYHEIMKTNMLLWVFGQIPLEMKINEMLKDHAEEERKEIFSIMSITLEDSYSKIEEKKFAKIAELAKLKGINNKDVKEKIKEFSQEYYWFPYEYVGPEIWDEKRWKDYKKVTQGQADVVAQKLGESGLI